MLYKLLIVAHNEMWARKGKIKANLKKKNALQNLLQLLLEWNVIFPSGW